MQRKKDRIVSMVILIVVVIVVKIGDAINVVFPMKENQL